MVTGFLSVDCDEGVSGTFRGLKLSIRNDDKEEVIRFDSGNPTVDFVDYSLGIPEGIGFVIHSSSVDHWYMDEDDYTDVYVHYSDDGTKLYHRAEINEGGEAGKLFWDDKLFEYPIHKDMKDKIKCFEDFKNHYKELKGE